MRKVKRDRLVMLMTKKDIETKEKEKNSRTGMHATAVVQKTMNVQGTSTSAQVSLGRESTMEPM